MSSNNIGNARRAYALSTPSGRFTQEDAAREFGVALGTYRNWEQGVGKGIKSEQLKQMSKLYGVSVDFLLGDSENNKAVADAIRRLRKAHDLTQGQLGAIAGVSAEAVSQWECGRAMPRWEPLESMSKFFGVPKSVILGEIPPENTIADGIRRLRKKAGLTVDQVGESIGRSGKTVSAWETGRSAPSASLLEDLCRFFDVPISFFFSDEVTSASETTVNESFKDNLVKLRKERNMTQQQLADILGVKRESVAQWEAGRVYPRMGTAIAMAEFFGLPLSELMGYSSEDGQSTISAQERELLEYYRSMDESSRELALYALRGMVALHRGEDDQ